MGEGVKGEWEEGKEWSIMYVMEKSILNNFI